MCLSLFWALLPNLMSSSQPPESCFVSLGCYSNLPPWSSNIRPVLPPQDPQNLDVTMLLYHQHIPDGIQFSLYPNLDLSGVPFDTNLKTYVILHGYQSNGLAKWIIALKNLILRRDEANVLVADYGLLSTEAYEQAVGDIRTIATLCARVLAEASLAADNTHLIGHGIGAHIAAYIANNLTESGKLIKQITALDPEALHFEGHSMWITLDQSDAEYVEVLHTNGGGKGFMSPIGHIDHYFNDGRQQPFCVKDPLPSECSHEIAADYYLEAIENECFAAKPGEVIKDRYGKMSGVALSRSSIRSSEVPVGYTQTDVGIYIVYTNDNNPFCKESH